LILFLTKIQKSVLIIHLNFFLINLIQNLNNLYEA
jgi:hypothetical protein